MQFKRLLFTITFLLNLLLAGFTQEPRLLDHGGGVQTVEFSPVDASLVASAGESNIIKLWNLRNNTARTLRGHTAVVNSVAFSPDGELLASGSDDRTIKLWNVHNSQNIATFQHDNVRIKSLAFAPDGRILATGGDRHIKLWNVGNWTEIATLRHEAWARALVFSPDGQFLAAGKGHEGPGIVTVWNVQTRQVIATLEGDSNRVRTLAFSPDNSILASSGRDRQLKLWDVSTWELLGEIPNTGHYDIAFSPDGKMIAGTNNGDVSLWWVEDGARVAHLPVPTDRIHSVDFSHDENFLVVGAEDGIVRIWHINTSLTNDDSGGVRILHVNTYLQQLPEAHSANVNNIPEPAPPPAVVRDFFELDPFYEQWINVGGLPIIASAKVNPYAVKEAAWIISKMLGHRPDVLRSMAESRIRFTIVAHNELPSEVPDIGNHRPYPFYSDVRQIGAYCTACETVYGPEENILYPGEFKRYSILIHEMAHGLHRAGLNQIDPTFDERLKTAYNAAMQKGLWRGTYASTDPDEYWAEGVMAWFYARPSTGIKSPDELRTYDRALANLIMEVFGDGEWEYTAPATRTHLPHFQRFSPQDAPNSRKWPPRVLAAYEELRDPNSNGDGKWVNLPLQDPSRVSHLKQPTPNSGRVNFFLVNLLDSAISLYVVESNETRFINSAIAGEIRQISSDKDAIWLAKTQNGRKLGVFQASAETGRVLIGTPANNSSRVRNNNSQPQVRVPPSQRPPMYWIDTRAGTIHRLVGAKVETFLPSVPKCNEPRC